MKLLLRECFRTLSDIVGRSGIALSFLCAAVGICSAETLHYDYDTRSELVKISGETNVYFECRYDTAGNLEWLADGNVTNYYSANSLNQYTAVSNNLGTVIDVLYDRSGNTSRIGPNCYSWNAEQRLLIKGPLVPVNGALVVRNEYDYLGRRIKKTLLAMKNLPSSQRWTEPQSLPEYDLVSVTTFVYDHYRLINEVTTLPNGQKKEIQYFWGRDLSGSLDGAGGIGGLLAVSIGGQFYYAIYDNIGNIFRYVDEAGKVVSYRTYSPFGLMKHGAETSPELAGQFHFWLSTKYYDEEMALYDFGSRYYSPFLRRWMNRDPLDEDGGIHLYRYVDNAPTHKVDPNGCFPLDTIWDLANVIYDLAVGDDVALAADTVALMIPYVPAGTTKLVKAAKLVQVKKICPGVHKLEVTYKYIHVDYHFPKGPLSRKAYVDMTKNKLKSYWCPGTTDEQVKEYINAALRKAKSEGKVKPSDLKGYKFDVGRPIGASNGNETSIIKIQIDSNGYIHAHPWPTR